MTDGAFSVSVPVRPRLAAYINTRELESWGRERRGVQNVNQKYKANIRALFLLLNRTQRRGKGSPAFAQCPGVRFCRRGNDRETGSYVEN